MADKKKKDKRSKLQKIGGHTLLPYLLKAAGFDEAAIRTGLPDIKYSKRMKKIAHKVPGRTTQDTEGFSRGGQVQGTKFKGTF